MKMLCDIKSLWKSLIVNLAVTAIWYAAEYEQFGALQWDRWGDNIIGIIYVFILWWAFHKHDSLLKEVINVCQKESKNKDGQMD